MFEDELRFAGELADRAAEIALHVFRGEFEIRTKPDLTPVTEADIRIEAMIRREVGRRYPSDAVLGEEGGRQGTGDRVWVVDPIDGTKNFAARVPIWGTLIALSVAGRPVLGVADAAALGERYEAARGVGATMNGRRIQVSAVRDISKASISIGGVGTWLKGPYRDGFLSMAEQADRVRGFGDFWGHMLVARGACDAMVEPSLRTWDWSALQVIVEEAGGRMTQVDGSPLTDAGSALSSNGVLHDRIAGRLIDDRGAGSAASPAPHR